MQERGGGLIGKLKPSQDESELLKYGRPAGGGCYRAHKYTNTNTQIQIQQKYKYTNTKIQIHQYEYTNTNTQILSDALQGEAKTF